jgi:sodium transport system permease protein
MNWNNVKLILLRELRDQLRDRRTLFMIAVLPLLMYPLLGMSIFQVSQFRQEHPTRVLIVGLPELPELPELVKDNHFKGQWLDSDDQSRLFDLDLAPLSSGAELAADEAKSLVQSGTKEAVVVFPADFASELLKLRAQLASHSADSKNPVEKSISIPTPQIYFSAANEKSQLAEARVAKVLDRWTDAIARQNLDDANLPQDLARPFQFKAQDISQAQERTAAAWSKVLPLVVLLWALTGAFYPAVDLCAGEKERGTLETLLCSPAQRSEIVTGKLLTVMAFSLATSVLNLLSLGLTGAMVFSHLPVSDLSPRLGMPPMLAQFWLLLALVPVSALFSALCVALAAFARSTKEGQYYLMPLVLVALPLVILPMGPGMELTLGNSLIPLTGLVLLLRTLLEGNYSTALPYVAPVVVVTIICCLLAIRWAVEQFNRESVLFRESERLDIGLWLKHLRRDRGATPSAAQALFCGVAILVIQFFLGFAVRTPKSFADITRLVVVTQLVVVVAPSLLLTIVLTRSPKQTLLLRKPAWWTVPAAALLAVSLHPAFKSLQVVIEQLYPMSSGIKDAQQQLTSALADAPSIWIVVLLVALVPAICEELAFRGFILSGFRHLGHKWWAIALSSAMFGVTHTMLHQSLVTTVAGAVIGYIAVQTGSIFPGMLFHFSHNALAIIAGQFHESGLFGGIIEPIENGKDFVYNGWLVGVGLLIALALLIKFAQLSYRKTDEEVLQETIQREAVGAGV